MISKKHKAIFIHIEKTAGTSIEKKLGLFNEIKRGVQDHRKLIYYEKMSKKAYKIENLNYFFYYLKRGKHKIAFLYLKNLVAPDLTESEYKTFYKFSFVRNTWDRIYSFYYNVMKDDLLKKNYGIDDSCSFEYFITHVLDHKNFNQLSYIRDLQGNVPLNFIGRFEFLKEDFNTVCKALNIKDSRLQKLLYHKRNTHYTQYYTESTKFLVHEFYKDEIAYFNFEFGEE